MRTSDIFIVAIDGKSGSGKTVLGKKMQERFGGNLFHMDDFFLRPQQRTKERLTEIGGNVDYERFAMVLEQIRNGERIFYQPYDCKSGEYKQGIWMEPHRINIVEGVYSMHPSFGDCYNFTIAYDMEEEMQKNRILARNGEDMLQRFQKEWIPKENDYLEQFSIFQKCDLLLKVTNTFQ